MSSLRMKLRAGAPKDTSISSPSSGYRTWYRQRGTSLEQLALKEAGSYRFNVLPWMGKDGKAHDLMYAWVHRSIGPNKDDFLCLGRGACPICREAEKLADTDYDSASALFAKERVLAIVQPIGPRGPEPIRFFETAARGKSSFITHLKAAQDVSVDKTWIADPDKGPTLSVLAQKAEFSGHSFYEVGRVDLQQRQFEVTDDVLDSVPCLEDWKVTVSAEDMEAALYGAPTSQQATQQEEAPQRTLADSSGKTFEDPYPDQPTELAQSQPVQQECSRAADIPTQQAPIQSATPVSQGAPVISASDGACPKGYRFGHDCDNMPLCSRCPDAIFEQCKAAASKR